MLKSIYVKPLNRRPWLDLKLHQIDFAIKKDIKVCEVIGCDVFADINTPGFNAQVNSVPLALIWHSDPRVTLKWLLFQLLVLRVRKLEMRLLNEFLFVNVVNLNTVIGETRLEGLAPK